jgi:hypothetical protein
LPALADAPLDRDRDLPQPPVETAPPLAGAPQYLTRFADAGCKRTRHRAAQLTAGARRPLSRERATRDRF